MQIYRAIVGAAIMALMVDNATAAITTAPITASVNAATTTPARYPTTTPPTGSCPKGIRARKDYESLTAGEWAALKGAITQLQKTPSSEPGKSVFEQYCHLHYQWRMSIHRNPNFLPWHRQFLANYERALQRINPDVVLPYWPWGKNYRQPYETPIITQDKYLGFKHGPSGDCSFRVNSPVFGPNHCITRNWDVNNKPGNNWYNSATLRELTQQVKQGYLKFEQSIEFTMHGYVHTLIGGNQGDMSQHGSPCDPLFYIHHAQVDRLWAIWQANGGGNGYEGDFNGKPVSIDDALPVYPDVRVRDTMDTKKYCYYYAEPMEGFALEESMGKQDIVESPLTSQMIKDMDLNETEVRAAEAFMNSLVVEIQSRPDASQKIVAAAAPGSGINVVVVTSSLMSSMIAMMLAFAN